MKKVSNGGIEYFVIDRIVEIQNQMLRLLKIVDNICREKNLQYFLDGGTAIGAYRHGGFIPWDDDLDICLLKNDYLKLVNVLRGMDRSKFFLFDYNQNLHPATFFGEKVSFFSCSDNKNFHIYPIKIDIIPLNVIENTEYILKENRLYRELSNYLFMGSCNIEFERDVLALFEQEFNNDKRKFMSFYNLKYGLCDVTENVLLARPSMNFSTSRLYNYNEIFPLKSIAFSGVNSFVPATDKWLKDIYGDYMSLPKLEDRKPEAATVKDASNVDLLYKHLIDKHEKTILQKLLFFVEANFFVKYK